MNNTMGFSPSGSRMGSLASIGTPMAVQRSDPTSGTVYFDRGETATVQVHTLPPRTWQDSQTVNGGLVRFMESRQAMQPTVSGPQTVNTNVWTEDMQPSYSTKSYETVRRDPASLFPGANIVSVGAPGIVQTPLGSVYNPRENTFYSRLTNQTAYVEPLAASAGTSYWTGTAGYASAPYSGTYVTSGTIPTATYGSTTLPMPAANPSFQVIPSPNKPSSSSATWGTSTTGPTHHATHSSSWKRY
eukprot:Gregarina_sp_Poly_1__6444@NODE_3444_length_1094_cov_1419_510224_g2181_i0_p1_GENE_NODE_3444_length_1094_cov_1419_510224_g2181_i0NODE_3444_length_1094_cov_1419_510224_g2181_i0_p1_ORF_typecomplete_len244_score14_82_NODE_3444_length_1094_cov_1419_510224_g2181_i0136867